MPNDVDIWMSETAHAVLTRVGLKKGQTVIDFGCGPGYTAIPAAVIVGETGQVYAIEKNRLDIFRLGRFIKTFGMENITPINTHGDLDLPLDSGTIDCILAFDVLLPYYFSDAELARVIKEMHRVSKPAGSLIIYPSHVSIDDIRPLITGAGFEPGERFTLPILHNGTMERGEIFTFTADGNG
ncbi:class I SAM-dependent methyltransferase [Pelagibius litoralis]|uniref:Class I SAM-dependent methyltransferase n=1 Tax=Pelagibius litoralis TaxID=374515 RepID=A0A967F3D1_9PROT|nr:class I SAM-dependent methyltransferase [Pelagibius litoralis]NIA72483.1 class I SAM-dependent methyltransferase [Pelagibius litoralis]